MSAQVLRSVSTSSQLPHGIGSAAVQREDKAIDSAFSLMGAPVNIDRNAEVFGEGEEAEYLYQVRTGCIRTYRVLNDGRRQVGAFYLPGDIIGIEAGNEHAFSAEAIVASTVRILKRSVLSSRVSGDSTLARQLFDMTIVELQRTQSHVLLLVKTALERVAGFLLEAAERAKNHDEIQLPMSRQDIADYLGLTIETVSRTLSHLEQTKTIALPTSRRVVLRNWAALKRLSA